MEAFASSNESIVQPLWLFEHVCKHDSDMSSALTVANVLANTELFTRWKQILQDGNSVNH